MSVLSLTDPTSRRKTVGPLPVRTYMALGACAAKLGDGRMALDMYQAAVDAAPSELSALRALLKRGEILAAAGDPRAAREAYTLARAHPACRGPWLDLVEKALAGLPPQPTLSALADEAVIERGPSPRPPAPPRPPTDRRL